MKWPAFAYAKAETLDALWSLRREAGPDVKIIAGGQSLLASLAFRLSQPDGLIDIRGIAALKGISESAGGVRIGALTTHSALGASPLVRAHAPLLTEAVPLIAHAAIRNRGTIGGNLAYADPASELPACLVALGASIVAVSPAGERRIPAGEFFTGLFETALAEDEIILAVEVPSQAPDQVSAIREVARRSGDYAMAGLAVSLTLTAARVRAARLVFFGVGETPVEARAAAAALVAEADPAKAIPAAQAALGEDLDPTGDQQASAATKMHLARVLLKRAVSPFLAPEAAAA